MDTQDYKIPELVEIDNQVKALSKDIQTTLEAIMAGELFKDGEYAGLRLTGLLDKLRLMANRRDSAEASQNAYNVMVTNMNAAIKKRAIATYADCLVAEFTRLHNTAIKELKRIATDNGSSDIERARKIARMGEVPQDIAQNAYRSAVAELDRVAEDVKTRYENDRGEMDKAS